jgi:hypothetical protein
MTLPRYPNGTPRTQHLPYCRQSECRLDRNGLRNTGQWGVTQQSLRLGGAVYPRTYRSP